MQQGALTSGSDGIDEQCLRILDVEADLALHQLFQLRNGLFHCHLRQGSLVSGLGPRAQRVRIDTSACNASAYI